MRHRAGASGLRHAERDDLALARAASRVGPEQPDRLAVPQSGRPGGSGVDFTLFAGPFLFTDEVRARFDLVGFDPRGIIRSSAFRCFGNDKQWDPYFTPFAFPSNAQEEAVWIAADHYLDDACARRGGRIGEHMSTANVARDLDVLRQAVGDDMLTYAGYSYGSFLGTTYANMFPGKVRALVVDGVLDPIAWTSGRRGTSGLPFSTRLRSDAGAMATLTEFFRLCDAGRLRVRSRLGRPVRRPRSAAESHDPETRSTTRVSSV